MKHKIYIKADKWFSYEKFFEEVKNRDGKSGKSEN